MADFFQSSQFDGNTSVVNASGQSDAGGNQNVARVSLSQIARLTRREDGLVIHRQKVHTLVTIGVVISVEELNTRNVYLIDDYTLGAPVEVQLWKNDNETGKLAFCFSLPFQKVVNVFTSTENVEYSPPPPIMENTYIRAVGQARFDERKPFVVAFRVEPIEDPNEIYLHFLNVIHDSAFLEKRLSYTLNNSVSAGGSTKDSLMSIENDSSRMLSGFNDIQRSVLNILNKFSKDSAYGLKRHEIRSYLSGVNPTLIDNAIGFLVNEGHIFSTTDDDTFKSTDF